MNSTDQNVFLWYLITIKLSYYIIFLLFILKKGANKFIFIKFISFQRDIVEHEIGHAIGFWHEQSRPDRDGFVTVVEGNVISSLLYNFEKKPVSQVNTFQVAYDYRSVMHYGQNVCEIYKYCVKWNIFWILLWKYMYIFEKLIKCLWIKRRLLVSVG